MDCDVQIKEEPVDAEDFGISHSDVMITAEKEQTNTEELMNFEAVSIKQENVCMEEEDHTVSGTANNESQQLSLDVPTKTSNLFVLEDYYKEESQKMRTEKEHTNNEELMNFETVSIKQENVSMEEEDHTSFATDSNERVFEPDIKYQGILKCSLCPGTYFINIQNLIEHGLAFHKLCFKCDRVSTEDRCSETMDRFNILLNCDQNNSKTRVMYECPTCSNMNFGSSDNLQKHLICVHGLKACSQCNAILAQGLAFKKHVARHNQIALKYTFKELISQPPQHASQAHFENTELQKHECVMCPDVFPNSLKLKHHLSSTHDFKLCTFPTCEKLFVTSEELKNHSRKCHPTKNRVLNHEELKNGLFKCKLCSLPFKSRLDLACHVNSEHAKCKICSVYFISNVHLAEHYTTDHPLNADVMLSQKDVIKLRKKRKPAVIKRREYTFFQFYCEICLKIVHSSSKRKHYKQVHKKSVSKFKCYECMDLMPFKTYGSLRRHRRERHPKYICDFCNRIFIDGKEAFENHVKTHVQNQCRECLFAGINPKALKTHVLNHHERFNCDQCSFTCFGSLNFISHVNETDHKFKCFLCNFTTMKGDSLREHYDHSHLRSKGFSYFLCDFCFFQCRSKDQLEEHNNETHLKT